MRGGKEKRGNPTYPFSESASSDQFQYLSEFRISLNPAEAPMDDERILTDGPHCIHILVARFRRPLGTDGAREGIDPEASYIRNTPTRQVREILTTKWIS
jgi:hypothetical protein